MNRLQPVRLSVLVLICFMAALAGGMVYFIMGMSHSTYLVTNGVTIMVRYLDKPRYDMQLQGLIFSLSFLIAGGLLLLMVVIPDSEQRYSGPDAAPQPRRRPEQAPQPAAQADPQLAAQAAPQPAAPQPAGQAAPQPASQAAQQSSPLTIEAGESEAPPPEAPAPQPPRPGVSMDEEVLQTVGADDLPNVDFGENRFDDAGDEDVVYGNGRITEDAAWGFVQEYPDSSVKFLYRKTLDNKPLTPAEDDIYRNWEMRGMTRAKVREIVLEIMRWQSLPDNFPHEIWKELRDEIFEIKSRS